MLSRLASMALAGIEATGLPTVRLSAQFKKAFDSKSVQASSRGRLGFPAGLVSMGHVAAGSGEARHRGDPATTLLRDGNVMTRRTQQLIAVLREAQALLDQPGNDYCWSSWENSEQALKEIERYIGEVARGDYRSSLQMQVIFAPTGPMQEVSLSSGWGQQFLDLAARFDKAIEKARKPRWQFW